MSERERWDYSDACQICGEPGQRFNTEHAGTHFPTPQPQAPERWFGVQGEHRTVGVHRAWCYDCREWCYADPAMRCEHCAGIDEAAATRLTSADAAQERQPEAADYERMADVDSITIDNMWQPVTELPPYPDPQPQAPERWELVIDYDWQPPTIAVRAGAKVVANFEHLADAAQVIAVHNARLTSADAAQETTQEWAARELAEAKLTPEFWQERYEIERREVEDLQSRLTAETQMLEACREEIRRHNEGLDVRGAIAVATGALEKGLSRQQEEINELAAKLTTETQRADEAMRVADEAEGRAFDEHHRAEAAEKRAGEAEQERDAALEIRPDYNMRQARDNWHEAAEDAIVRAEAAEAESARLREQVEALWTAARRDYTAWNDDDSIVLCENCEEFASNYAEIQHENGCIVGMIYALQPQPVQPETTGE